MVIFEATIYTFKNLGSMLKVETNIIYGMLASGDASSAAAGKYGAWPPVTSFHHPRFKKADGQKWYLVNCCYLCWVYSQVV